MISPSKNVTISGYSSVRFFIFRYPQRYAFSSSTCCKTTSTSYWFPLDFWCPVNLDPLYSRVHDTPGCFEFTGGGGTTSLCVTFTGILVASSFLGHSRSI